VSGSIAVDLDGASAFREPWQAKAFAFVMLLHREGHFTWDDWVRTLAEAIAASP
jgi:nitrile hydratase accessory protein